MQEKAPSEALASWSFLALSPARAERISSVVPPMNAFDLVSKTDTTADDVRMADRTLFASDPKAEYSDTDEGMQ